MATTPKTTKQLHVLADNELLKDQQNLLKQIEHQLVDIAKVTSVNTISIDKQIKELTKETDFQEQILKASKAQQEIDVQRLALAAKIKTTYSLWNAAVRTGNAFLAASVFSDLEKLRAEGKILRTARSNLVVLQQQTSLLREQEEILDDLKRNADWLSALNLNKYTSQIQDFSQRLALYFRGNIAAQNAILGFFRKNIVLITFTYAILHKVWEIFKSMDKSFFEFRKKWGLLRSDSREFEQRMFRITKETAHLGVTFDDAVEAMTKLAKESGSLLDVSDEMVKIVVILNKSLGISADLSSKFLKTMASVSQSTISSQDGMLGLAQSMASAYKVPLHHVMEDVAKASASSYAYISKNPAQLIKAAVEARRFGTSLTSLANSAKSLLNFTESVESEMEASVLLGRGVNLQLARQLAYNKDFVGLNKEIVRLAKEFRYNQMDPYQQAAFAKSLGKTEEELGKILQSSQEDIALRNRANQLAREGNTTLQKQIEKRDRLQAQSQSELKDLGKKAEKEFQRIRNQERLNAVTDQWKQIFLEISEAIIPIIDFGVKILAPLVGAVGHLMKISLLFGGINGALLLTSDLLTSIGSSMAYVGRLFTLAGTGVRNISGAMKKFYSLVNDITNIKGFGWVRTIWHGIGQAFVALGKLGSKFGFVKTISKFFGSVFSSVGGIITKLASGAGWLGKWFGLAARFFGIFGKWVPVVGWVITGLQFIGNLIRRIVNIDTSKGFWNSIWQGIKAIGGALYDTLIQPFVDVWNWLKRTFFGSSPSQLGLLIVKGIKAVGMMIQYNLLSPFTEVWKLVNAMFTTELGKNLLSGLESIGSKIYNFIITPFKKAWEWIAGLFGNGVVQPNVQKPAVAGKAAQLGVPIDRLVPDNDIRSYKELDNAQVGPERQTIQSPISQAQTIENNQAAILKVLNEIKDGLENGKISVNIDGQLVSTALNRGSKFRGEYGAMK